jgi:hypothetical protein
MWLHTNLRPPALEAGGHDDQDGRMTLREG